MRISALFLTALLFAIPSVGAETIAYWAQNDNNLPGGGFGFQPGDFPQAADVGSGSLNLTNFDSATQVNSNGDTVYQCIQSFGGTTINSEPGFPGGGSLSPQGCSDLSNNGMQILLTVSTEGYESISLSWAQQRTSTGFDSSLVEWSADSGGIFDTAGNTGVVPGSFALQSFDLSAVSALDDNPNVVFRITLDGATATAGNNRFDNIRVSGTALDGGPIDPSEPILEDDFSSDPFLNGWTEQNVAGNQTWSWNSNFNNVQFSAFSGECQVNDNWLISPAIDLANFTDVELAFSLSRDFSGTNDLEVYFSSDYPGSGLPGGFTWTLIDSFAVADLAANNTNYPFGPYDALAGQDGEVFVAFRAGWESTDVNCATWRVVDFAVTGVPEQPFCAVDSGTDESLTRIHAIQGNDFSSPMVGSIVEVQAVVVGAFQDTGANQIGGFFLQELDANVDDDPLTSEGVYISDFQASITIPDVEVGQEIRVAGEVRERFGQTQVFRISNFEVCAQDRLAEVSPAVVEFPVDDLIELESVEGMWVRLPQALAVTEVFNAARYAEFAVAVDRLFQPTQVAAPDADANDLQDLNDRSRVIVDQGLAGNYRTPYQAGLDGTSITATNPIRAGYRIQPNFEGVMGFGFSNYRLFALQPAEFDDSESPRSLAAPDLPEGNLRMASFNVNNLFSTIQTGGVLCGPDMLNCRGAESESELARQLIKLTETLLGLNADLVGLVEIENDADDETLDLLVEALNAIDPVKDWAFIATGHMGTDAIKNAIIYRTGKLAPIGSPAVLDGSVTVTPPFNDERQRPVLTQAFEHLDSAQIMALSVFHLRSKNCGSNASGPNLDQGDGQGCWNAIRTESVESFVNWLATDPTGTGTDLHLVSGDLNAYAQEDPLQVLVNEGYVNQAIAANDHDPAVYGFVFMGQSGSLDHVMASPAMNDMVLGATTWAINADEIPAFAYPETLPFSSLAKPEDFFNEDPFRSSDHDPLIVSLQLPTAPALVQLAHLAPFAAGPASEVEIRVNGQTILAGVAYGDSTGYLALEPGPADIAIIPAGAAEPAIAVSTTLESNVRYTAIAIGDGINQGLALSLVVDDISTPAAGQFKLRLGHLAPFDNGPAAAEVRLADGTLLAAVDFGDIGGFVELPAGTYDLVITAPGGDPVLIDPIEVSFADGDIVSALATGNGSIQPLGAFALPSGQPGVFIDIHAGVVISDLIQTFTGAAVEVSVTTQPADLSVEVSYDGQSDMPVDAGSYGVVATITEPGFVGSAAAMLVIEPAEATVSLTNLQQLFTGGPLQPTVTSDPADLDVVLSFDGLATAPTAVGDYIATASIDENNYTGTASAIFRIVSADGQLLEILSAPAGNNGPILQPALSVAIIDGSGEIATDDHETAIEVFLLIDAGSATRAAAFASASVINGVATFDNLLVDQPGTGYRLLVQDVEGTMPPVISAPFDVLDGIFGDRFEQ